MPDDKGDSGSASGPAPPDPGASAWRVLERLSDAECMELLASGGVGRLVYTSRYGPTALPVAYKADGESVVLGTWDPALFDEDLRTGIAQAEYQVAVEVDQIDGEAREGWFVLVRGPAHHLDTEAERAPFMDAGLEPWIEGVPAHLIRVESHHDLGQPRPPGMIASGSGTRRSKGSASGCIAGSPDDLAERQIPGVARQCSAPSLSGHDALRHSHRDLDRLRGDTSLLRHYLRPA